MEVKKEKETTVLICSVSMSKNLLGGKTGKLRKTKEVLKNVTASASKTD
ncbi:hypothetical protein JOD14_000949 [Enterococcus lemanii]|nr:hypothetical protein [Enterococcus lemanii]